LTPLVTIAGTAFVHPSAQLYGKVSVGDGASVWCNAVVRSEIAHVEIHAGANIQDFVMIHTDPGKPVTVGAYCSITHHATLHGCTIGDGSLIGIGSIILNGAKIGRNCLIGAGALITEGKVIPDGSLVMGMPGKVVRQLDEAAINGLRVPVTRS
jgi:carbonic anhydrase/acetyltransferase-like protein (isoleucine patch superfamily)